MHKTGKQLLPPTPYALNHWCVKQRSFPSNFKCNQIPLVLTQNKKQLLPPAPCVRSFKIQLSVPRVKPETPEADPWPQCKFLAAEKQLFVKSTFGVLMVIHLMYKIMQTAVRCGAHVSFPPFVFVRRM